jgi:outer membrane immunogenic protein
MRPALVGQEQIMKRFLCAAVAAATLAGPAFAADLPRRPIQDTVVMPVAPAGVWTGFYVGAHLGAGFSSRFNNDVGFGLGSASGFLGGLQAGYDYQADRFVMGVVGDLSYAGISRRHIDAIGPNDVRANLNWNGSLRARLGYLVQDNLLLYATGGLALGNVEARELVPAVVTQSRSLVGWTAGVGGEYMFTRNVSALLEYRYTSLSRANYLNLSTTPRIGFEGHTIRTGLNYRF